MRRTIIERIDDSRVIRLLRYAPWEGIPGLLQGVTVKDQDGAGVEYARLTESVAGMGFRHPARLHQVHGRRVLDSDVPEDAVAFHGPVRPDADGVIGSEPGVLGVVSAADCVPAFLLDRANRRWAAVHAGWRGVVAGVLAEAVRVMTVDSASKTVEPELYLGPSICGACYEVGRDVAGQLAAAGGGSGIDSRGGSWFADLRAILVVQAAGARIQQDRIAVSAYCTRCHHDLFCSFRGEGREGLGRMWGVIGFRA